MDGRRGEYSKVSGIELGKIVREKVTRAKALQTLGLSGMPSPKLYDQKVRDLLKGDSDLATTSAVHAAHSRLQKDHQAAVADMRTSVDRAYEFHDLDALSERAKEQENTIKKAGKALIKLSRDYCKKLAEVNVDIKLVEQEYQSEFLTAMTVVIDSVPKDLREDLSNEFIKFRADIKVAYAHVLERTAEDMEVIEIDPISMFQEEFNYYLEDIVSIQATESEGLAQAHENANRPLLFPPRFEKDLTILHDKLGKIGGNYFTEIAKKGANVDKINQEFRKDFTKAVTDAKHAFAKEPGIWANLSCIVKFLAIICLCIPAIIIICCEKSEDRHRLFHGKPAGELDINNAWHDMSMDIMPDPDMTVSRRNK